MSFVEVNAVSEDTVNVDYMGGTIDINANHSWLAVQSQGGKSVLISFEQKPYIVEGQWASTGDYSINCEVAYIKPEDALRTLRKVQGLTLEECILSNAEELSHKIAATITADLSDDEKIVELFHVATGLFVEFHSYQDQLLVDKVKKENKRIKEEKEAERLNTLKAAADAANAALNAEIARQNPEPEVPACNQACDSSLGEVKGTVSPNLVDGSITANKITSTKPRVRVIAVI